MVIDSSQVLNEHNKEVENVIMNNSENEIKKQYVTELVYPHSKLLIADDRVVICGSANINDRSMLGSNDSEICVVIEDQHRVDATMNGENVSRV